MFLRIVISAIIKIRRGVHCTPGGRPMVAPTARWKSGRSIASPGEKLSP